MKVVGKNWIGLVSALRKACATKLVSEEKGAICGIEYIPGEHAWRPVEASGYIFIHCIYIMKKELKLG